MLMFNAKNREGLSARQDTFNTPWDAPGIRVIVILSCGFATVWTGGCKGATIHCLLKCVFLLKMC
jgi:hypothetical protein